MRLRFSLLHPARRPQTNEVFESNKNERSSPEPQSENDDRVAVTSRDVALFNSDLELANSREKSTKDKVRHIQFKRQIAFRSLPFFRSFRRTRSGWNCPL